MTEGNMIPAVKTASGGGAADQTTHSKANIL